MATAPLPSQCGEHVEPGGDQPRRQIAAASSSSSSFSHIETLTNTRPGARATGGASPRAREPMLLPAGASLPAAWWCRVSRYRRREGGGAGGRSPVCLSLSFRLSLSEQNADRKCSCRNDSLRRRQTLTTTPSSHSTSATAAAAAAASRAQGSAAPLPSTPLRAALGCAARWGSAAGGRAGRPGVRAGGSSGPSRRPSPGRPRRCPKSGFGGAVCAPRRGRRLPQAFFSSRPTAAGSEFGVARARDGAQAWGAWQAADGGGRRPCSAPLLAMIRLGEPRCGRLRRGRRRGDHDREFFKMHASAW